MPSRTSFRTEKDALGKVQVPSDRYWGAQTQRWLDNFGIGSTRFPRELIAAYGLIKEACAEVNAELGALAAEKSKLIVEAAREVSEGRLDDHFPLTIFQTGSGTNLNTNVNEVIANRAIEAAGGQMGSKTPIHPNDDVNRSQSSNDTFPTAMHVAAVTKLRGSLLPEVGLFEQALSVKAAAFRDVIKIGRTHLQDAVPMTLGQEISGWMSQVSHGRRRIEAALTDLLELAIGGTAVGTGLNAPPGFGEKVAARLSARTGFGFRVAENRFEALAAHDAIAQASASLRTLAGALIKIANDVRWLASGPRSGIGEIRIPANEPGSSIMPGKVNPTQSEAMTMVGAQVYGLDAAIALAASQGNFELNVFKPLMIANLLEGAELLRAALKSFRLHCLDGLEPDRSRIQRHLEESLMLVTALTPHIGYDKAAEAALKAHREGTTLEAAVVGLGYATPKQFRDWADPRKMI